jgi:hypothetical protein
MVLEGVQMEEIAEDLFARDAQQADVVGLIKETRISITNKFMNEEMKEGSK